MNKITFFPVDNGDTTMFEVDNKTIMTDCHYRKKTKDDENDDYDFGDDIRNACSDGLDIFVLTHPDQDHLLGTQELFHLDKPDNCPKGKILIKEIWCSPYSVNPHYSTDASKPLLDEIARRDKLTGSAREKDGNKLKVLSLDLDEQSGSITENISWLLLAPNSDEAEVEKGDEESQNSSNDTSLVIRWSLSVDGRDHKILIGGDATVEVWDRVWVDNKSDIDNLEWEILLTPHHCSRGALARKDDHDVYQYSDDANNALSQMSGCGYAISSSKKVKKDSDNPPSWNAKQKYLKILSNTQCTDEKERFLNPAIYGKNEKPAPVIFELSKTGLTLKSSSNQSLESVAAILGAGADKKTTYG